MTTWLFMSPGFAIRTRIFVFTFSSSIMVASFSAIARLNFSNTTCLAGSKSSSYGSKNAVLIDFVSSLPCGLSCIGYR